MANNYYDYQHQEDINDLLSMALQVAAICIMVLSVWVCAPELVVLLGFVTMVASVIMILVSFSNPILPWGPFFGFMLIGIFWILLGFHKIDRRDEETWVYGAEIRTPMNVALATSAEERTNRASRSTVTWNLRGLLDGRSSESDEADNTRYQNNDEEQLLRGINAFDYFKHEDDDENLQREIKESIDEARTHLDHARRSSEPPV